MKTTEEKAKSYAESNRTVAIGVDMAFDISKQVESAYMAGAREALSGQWRDAKKDPPPYGERIICATVNVHNEIKELCVGERVGEISYRDWNDEYSYIGCDRWMYEPPLPEPPKDESV